jgi:hypothetical protein
MMLPFSRAAMLALLCVPWSHAPSRTQDVPTIDVGKRTGRSPFSFGNVINAVGLSDGRAVVGDGKEHAFRLVDFDKNQMPMLGQPGDGPLDYRAAGKVMNWHGDTLLLTIWDPSAGRMLVVSPQGELVSSIPVPRPDFGPQPEKGVLTYSSPFAVDSSDASYYLVELLDSTISYFELGNILRVGADGKQLVVDHIRERGHDQLKPRKSVVVMPFMYHDDWALRRDGLGARIVADTYQVVWFRDGHETGRTGPIPYTPIPVTAAEQAAFRDSIIERWNPKPALNDGSGTPRPATASAGGAVGIGGVPTTGDNTPRNFTPPPASTTLRIPDLGPYPDHKPAIPNSRWQTVSFFDPAGRLWIVRERAHSDNIPHIDVVEEGKGVVAHINLPKNTRIAGFGPGAIYLVSHDDNGDWLERYPMPQY